MFSQVEENYIKALINTYKKQGYKYYICHTVTENNNEYDVYIYFSKEEIKAINRTTFDLNNSLYIQLDTSTRNDNSYNPNNDDCIRIINSNYSTILSVHQSEFIYTNALFKTGVSTVVNPDLMLQNTDSQFDVSCMCIIIVLLVVTFLYTFFSNILRIRR